MNITGETSYQLYSGGYSQQSSQGFSAEISQNAQNEQSNGLSVSMISYQRFEFSAGGAGAAFASVAESVVAYRANVSDGFESSFSDLGQLSGRLLGRFNQFLGQQSESLSGAGDRFMGFVEEGFAVARSMLSVEGELDNEINNQASVQFSAVKEGVGKRVEQEELVQSADVTQKVVSANDSSAEKAEAPLKSADSEPVSGDAVQVTPPSTGDSSDIVSVTGVQGDAATSADNDADNNDSNEDQSDSGLGVVGSGVFARQDTFGSFEFALTTQDGDVVRISMASMESQQFAMGRGQGVGLGGMAVYGDSLSFGDFLIDVEGELDADELLAIRDLLGQAEDIGQYFFDADFEKAFDAALSMNMDTTEIASFSLDLLYVERSQIGAYTNAGQNGNGEGAGNSGANIGGNGFMPLARMAEKALSLLDTSSQFEAQDEINTLLDAQLARSEESAAVPERLSDYSSYIKALLERLE